MKRSMIKAPRSEEKTMCRTREQILTENQVLSDFLNEVEATERRIRNKESENGETLIGVWRDRLAIEGEIRSIQNSDDIIYLRAQYTAQTKHGVKYPSIFYLMYKMPKAFWPLMLALALIVWLISGIQPLAIEAILINAGLKMVEGVYIQWFVIILIAILFFTSFIGYGAHLEKLYPGGDSVE